MQKIITFRANEYDLNMLQDLKTWLDKTWKNAGVYKQVTMSDVIFQAIINDWQNKCLPFFKEAEIEENKPDEELPFPKQNN